MSKKAKKCTHIEEAKELIAGQKIIAINQLIKEVPDRLVQLLTWDSYKDYESLKLGILNCLRRVDKLLFEASKADEALGGIAAIEEAKKGDKKCERSVKNAKK